MSDPVLVKTAAAAAVEEHMRAADPRLGRPTDRVIGKVGVQRDDS